MLFHPPESEDSLRRMASTALRGAAMERSDIRVWTRLKGIFKFVFWESVMMCLLCLITGVSAPQLRAAAWRDFMLAGTVMLSTWISCQRFFWLLQSSPTVNVMWHLPVTGRDICRWVRRTSLQQTLKMLPRMMVAAWAWLSFPDLQSAWMQVLWNGALLWLVMVACVQHYSLSWGPGRLPAKIWNLTLLVWLGMVLYVWWGEKNFGHGRPLPAWVLDLSGTAAWILPAKWAMRAHDNQIALCLTLICLVAGGLFWRRFPDAFAIVYDYVGNAAPPEKERAEASEMANPFLQESAEAQPGEVMACIRLAQANDTPLVAEGWIEKLALVLLNKRDRMLLPTLIGTRAGWTGQWWKAVRICIVLLVLSFVLLTVGTRWSKAETAGFWTAMLPFLVIVSCTFPFSNSIPHATLRQRLGAHGMPFFAGLPICLRDLLRVYFRITLALMIACLGLVLPVIVIQCVILHREKFIPGALGMALIFCLSWCAMRPAFLYYRLQQMSRPGRSHRLGHVCSYILFLPLGLATVASVVVGIGVVQEHPVEAVTLCVPLAACCARGIYALFHWRVRACKVDWISDT
ncbi:hypothetical protein [Prosthecobacter sp.]|uniref:hypothetical protein n=1 Tax=Prosthecobacter sp. TaxID=1965333 RepID=UPI003784ADDB